MLLAASTLFYTGRQVVLQQKQFLQTNQESRYNDILAGLSNPAPAVQISAISALSALSALIDFVADRHNFANSTTQRSVRIELQRTLVESIKSTADHTSDGLLEYRRPKKNWTLAVTATKQLQDLLQNPALHNVALQNIDLNGADLHGYSQDGLHISANVSLDGVDLREAVLTNIQIDPGRTVNLKQADLTCADLYGQSIHPAQSGRG